MAIKGKQFDLQTVKAVDDANIFKFFSDGVLRGCAVTYTSSTITIAAGYLIAAGREIQVDSAYTVTPTDIIQNGYVRLKLKIDLSQTASATEFTQGSIIYDYSTTTTFTDLVQGDINGGGDTVYEIEIAVCKIEAGNITEVTRSTGGAIIDAAKLGGHEASYFARVNSPVFQTNIATPKIVIPAGTTSMEVYQTDNLALIIKNSGTGGIITKSGSPDGLISQDLNGALAPVRTSSLGFGGTVSIVGKSGTANVLIMHGGTNNAMQLRAPSAYFRKDDGTDTLIPVYGASFTNPSSRKYKKFIVAATDAGADKLLDVNIYDFVYKDDAEEKPQRGVIVEEIEPLGEFEHAIVRDFKTGEADGVDYSKFVPDLIKLCQKQQAQIDALTKKLETLEAAI